MKTKPKQVVVSSRIFRRKTFVVLSVDLLTLYLTFVVGWVLFKLKGHFIHNVPISYFLIFSFSWVLSGIIFDKYNFNGTNNFRFSLSQVILCNTAVVGLFLSILYFYELPVDKKYFVFSIILATIAELIYTYIDHQIGRTSRSGYLFEAQNSASLRYPIQQTHTSTIQLFPEECKGPVIYLHSLKKFIIEEVGPSAYTFISTWIGKNPISLLAIATTSRFNILSQPYDFYEAIVNLRRINDIQFINKFFETVNSKLPVGGIFIGCAETYVQRKAKILNKYPPVLNWIVYTIDFVLTRVFPKLAIAKKIYFFFTGGKNRVISRAETLGRLYSCGFEVLEDRFIDGLLWYAVRKVKEPSFDFHPTYGPLIKLKRLGKNNKIIGVYKMRTMHAYSEYLQQYIFERNSLQEGGKFADDFRITTIGKFMRKYWLDELPMLINVLLGDLKIVGVRPLSKHYFSLYAPDLQERRSKFKPGLIPPYYADMPKTLEEIQESERRYLDAYEKHPFLTDFRYFWKAVYNIIFKKARSK